MNRVWRALPGWVLLAACAAPPPTVEGSAAPARRLPVAIRGTGNRQLAEPLQAALRRHLVFLHGVGARGLRVHGTSTDSGPLQETDYSVLLAVPGTLPSELKTIAVSPATASIDLEIPGVLRLVRVQVTGDTPANDRLVANSESGFHTEVPGTGERMHELLLPPGPCTLELTVPNSKGSRTFTRTITVTEDDVQDVTWEVAVRSIGRAQSGSGAARWTRAASSR
jgi:hypothetical protein